MGQMVFCHRSKSEEYISDAAVSEIFVALWGQFTCGKQEGSVMMKRAGISDGSRRALDHEYASCCNEINSLSLTSWLWHKLRHVNLLAT
jgi:hypothetical protein